MDLPLPSSTEGDICFTWSCMPNILVLNICNSCLILLWELFLWPLSIVHILCFRGWVCQKNGYVLSGSCEALEQIRAWLYLQRELRQATKVNCVSMCSVCLPAVRLLKLVGSVHGTTGCCVVHCKTHSSWEVTCASCTIAAQTSRGWGRWC
jgi:hypothetical protein